MSSYDHSMYMEASLIPGTTVEQVKDAISPIWEKMEKRGLIFIYSPESGGLTIETTGDADCDYADTVREALDNLSPLLVESGEAELRDHDTADLENAITRLVFGPTEESRKEFTIKRDIETALDILSDHISAEGIKALRSELHAYATVKFPKACKN